MGVRQAREKLGDQVNAAHYLAEHTIIERNGTPLAVLMPHRWGTEQQNHPA